MVWFKLKTIIAKALKEFLITQFEIKDFRKLKCSWRLRWEAKKKGLFSHNNKNMYWTL